MFKRNDLNSIYIISSNMASLHQSGLNIDRILIILQNILTSKVYKKAIENVYNSVSNGETLALSFEKEGNLFPVMFIELVRIGEYSGELDSVLKSLGIYYKKKMERRKKIKSILVYPIILVLSLILLSLFVIFFLIPQIMGLYNSFNSNIPSNIKNIYSYVVYVKNNTIYVCFKYICNIIVCLLVCKILKVHKLILKMFKSLKIVKLIHEKNLIFILTMLFTSGIPIVSALTKLKDNVNDKFLRENLKNLYEFLNRGEILSDYFKSKNFSKRTYSMIKVGEESGTLDQKLLELLKYIEDDIENSTKKLLSFIEPSLIIFLGCMIALLIINTIIPIYSGLGDMI